MTSKERKVITMRVLDAAAVGALEDPPVSAATIRKRLKRYPAGTDNAYPAPLPDKVNGGYAWSAEDIPKLRAWKGTGSGKGGGRPRKTATAGTPATGSEKPSAAPNADRASDDTRTPPSRAADLLASNVGRVLRKGGWHTSNDRKRAGIRCRQVGSDTVFVTVDRADVLQTQTDEAEEAMQIAEHLRGFGYNVDMTADRNMKVTKNAATGTPETGGQAHADVTGDTSGPGQSTPDPFAPLAPLRPINGRATEDVFRDLQRQKNTHDIWGTAGETFSFESREVYRKQAMSWLRDNSELSNRTIEAADWNEVYDYFRAIRHGADTTPEPAPEHKPEPSQEPAPEPFANRRLSDDPAHEGMTSLGQIVAFEHQRAKEKRAAERREAKHRKTLGAPTVTDPATAAKVSVDVVEPGKAVIVGPGFQARAGIDTDAKSRRYWVELSSSDTCPGDVEKVIGHARTYAGVGEVAARWHRLANYYVDVEIEK